MIDSLFLYILILVIIINIAIKFLEKYNNIKEHTQKLSEMQKKYMETIKSGKIDEISKISDEFTKIYSKVMKHTIMVTIVGIAVLIIITYVFSTGFVPKIVNNSTTIYINNPVLHNQDFAIYYNHTFLGFYTANNNIITLNNSYIINKLSINPITSTLPFKIPILNVNWLSPIITYIILYLITQLLILLYTRFIKKSPKINKNG